MIAIVNNATPRGDIRIPASKSHTIRALLIAALADGESVVANPLDSQDARSCISAVKLMGAQVEEIPGGVLGYPRALKIRGVGAGRRNGSGILADGPADIIDCGNSGTTLYLAAGIAALSPGAAVFTGDHQIRSRPIRRLLNALNDLGAQAYTTRRNTDAAPFVVRGPLSGGKTSIECPTSQFLSSLMLAAPLMPAGSAAEIEVPLLMEQPYAEMTERWLIEQGIEIENRDWKQIRIPGGQKYTPFSKPVPADFSSATFFACAAAITGSTLNLLGLDMNDSQGDKAVFAILEQMGCRVEVTETGVSISGPDYAAGEVLKAGSFDLNDIPDSLPALAVTASYSVGETRLENVPQARLKETDRISCMHEELGKMGVQSRELEDGLIISGGQPKGADVDSHHDHRIVMALAIAALRSDGEMRIGSAEAAAVTFPDFFSILNESSAGDKTNPAAVLKE